MSDLKKLFSEITYFLNQHNFLVQNEPLFLYPHDFAPYQNWICELEKLSTQKLIDFENNEFDFFSPEFKNFLNQIQTLQNKIQKTNISPISIPFTINRKLSPKKTHEISLLVSLIKKNHFKKIFDVGSGVGHLSMALASNTDAQIISIDMNKDFQKLGLEKINHHLPELKNKIHYLHQEFSQNSLGQVESESALVGLHSCGDLSTLEITTFAQSQLKSLFNIGCCYHKIKNYQPLSKWAQEQKFHLSDEALHLAAHCYNLIDEKNYQKRYQIKSYRYLLHMFMVDELQLNFKAMKSAIQSDYQLEFADYAIKMLGRVGIDFYEKNLLKNYFHDQQNHNKFYQIFLYGILRGKIGRLVEIAIVLDRCLYLEEQGKKVTLSDIFKQKLSPRNLLISC